MPVTKEQKKEILAELVDSFKEAKSIVFTQYQGTNVKNMRLLRRRLRGSDVKFKVARKTLVEIAAKNVGLAEIPKGFMEGPIGLAFARGDSVAGAKIINDFAKEAETVKMAGLYFEGKFLSGADAKAIATLPSREVLLARLVGSLKSPISGFHRVLHGLLRNFVYCMSEVQKKRAATPT